MKTYGLQWLALSVMIGGALTGCGGGGAPAPAGNPSAQDMNFGDLRTRISVVSGPVNATGTASTIIGLTGNLSYAAIPLPIGREIAYQQSGIWVINTDGTNRFRIPDSLSYAPQWSPDGTRILLGRDGSDTGIYVISADGSISLYTGYGRDPRWSPDGTRVVYSSYEGNSYEIFVSNADGTNRVRLTNNFVPDYSPTWSPDGTRIAFVREESSGGSSNREIYVINANGTNETRLTQNSVRDENPIWAPNGTRIAFVRYDGASSTAEIYAMNPDGYGQTRLTTNSVNDLNPRWSPDSTRILFVRTESSVGDEVYVMNANGTNQTRLTNNNVTDYNPVWSPDGTRIAFVRSNQIWLMNADGSNQTRLVDGDFPSWGSGHALSLMRVLVGTNGLMGTSAGGFLYGVTISGTGRPFERAGSLMVFDASSRASLRVSPLSPQNPVAVPTFLLTGSNLTLLQWYNFSTQETTRVIGSQGPIAPGGASSILITYDGSTGLPTSFLPYTRSRADESPEIQIENGVQVLRGAFSAVIDASTGENLAPNGATEVRLDLKTGKVLGWK